MNNLLLYCGIVDARISAFEEDLPVPQIGHAQSKFGRTFFKLHFPK